MPLSRPPRGSATWLQTWTATIALVLLAIAIPGAHAIQESDAGIIDWYKPLIGVPIVQSIATSPAFYRSDGLRDGNDLIVSITGSNVLGALNTSDGSMAWRHVHDYSDPLALYKVHNNLVAALSGPGGCTLRTYDLAAGHLQQEVLLHSPEIGHFSEPLPFGKSIVFSSGAKKGDKDHIYVLSNGYIVNKVERQTGEIKWTWTAEDQSSSVIYAHLILTPSTLHVLGVAKSFDAYNFHLTSLSTVTGEQLASVPQPSKILDPLRDYLLLSASSASSNEELVQLVWLERDSAQPEVGALKSLTLQSDLASIKVKPVANGSNIKELIDVRVALSLSQPDLSGDTRAEDWNGRFVAVRQTGANEIWKLSAAGALEKVWEFEGSDPSDSLAPSIFSGGFDALNRPYIARLYWSPRIQRIAIDVYCPHLADGLGLAAGYSVPFDSSAYGRVLNIALDPSNPVGWTTLNRVLFTTSTGSLQLWDKDELKWTREEGLTSISVAELVELPDTVGVDEDEVATADEGFVHRIFRQIKESKDFPAYLVNFVHRFVSGSSAIHASSPDTVPKSKPNAAIAPPSSDSANNDTIPLITRDQFGLRQLIIACTGYGKLYALDTLTGDIVWSRLFGLGWANEVGGQILGVKLFVLSDGSGARAESDKRPEVILVAQRRAENSLMDTVIFHVDALTGSDASSPTAELEFKNKHTRPPLEGVDIVQGPLVEAYFVDAEGIIGDDRSTRKKSANKKAKSKLLSEERTKFVVLLDEYLQTYIYPSTPSTLSTFDSISPKLSFSLRTTIPDTPTPSPHQKRLVGHKLALDPSLSDRYVGYPTWRFTLPEREHIVSVVAPRSYHPAFGKRESIASVGHVLGNRTTLYKYLNGAVSVVLTSAPPVQLARSRDGAEDGSDRVEVEEWDNGYCAVYLVDNVKGTLLYRAALPAIQGPGLAARGGGCQVKAELTENWLVYHYWDGDVGSGGGSNGETKGWKVVSVELYEGTELDDKIKSSDLSSFSKDVLHLTALERTFVFPHGVTAMTTTRTKYGISSKDLIVATDDNKIQAFSRRLLNPRRPSRKPTTEEAEEGIMQYDPLLPDDPGRVLSHTYEVAQPKRILSSPTLLESTSLVFVHGLDLFLTRVSPSGTFDVLSENFNKVQLVFTILGLGAGIGVVRPMVRRKKLKEKWYHE